MGKKREGEVELPALGNVISEEQASTQTIVAESFEIGIRIPMITPCDGHAVRHVETKLSTHEARAFKAVMLALVANHTKLRNGRIVKRPADVYRWLAEEITKQYANHDRHSD